MGKSHTKGKQECFKNKSNFERRAIMKQIKKIVSMILAAVMVIAMTIPAFAADNNQYTIKVNTNPADKNADRKSVV